MKQIAKKPMKIRTLATKDLIAASGGGNFVLRGYFEVTCPNCNDNSHWEGGSWQTCACCGQSFMVY